MQRVVSLVHSVGPAHTADESKYAACCVTGLLCCPAQTADESKYAACCVYWFIMLSSPCVPCCKSDDMSENVTDTICLLLWLNTKN